MNNNLTLRENHDRTNHQTHFNRHYHHRHSPFGQLCRSDSPCHSSGAKLR
ncbi:hypothetical protein [Moraxella lacunata]